MSSKPSGLRKMPVEELGEKGERPNEWKITDIWLKVQELHMVLMKGQRMPSLPGWPSPGCLQRDAEPRAQLGKQLTKTTRFIPCPSVWACIRKPGGMKQHRRERRHLKSESMKSSYRAK